MIQNQFGQAQYFELKNSLSIMLNKIGFMKIIFVPVCAITTYNIKQSDVLSEEFYWDADAKEKVANMSLKTAI